MVSLMDLSMYTAIISAILLFGLILIYARIYRETRAHFSLGLLVFALILFAQNVLAAYPFLTMSPSIGEPCIPNFLTGTTALVRRMLVVLRPFVYKPRNLDKDPTSTVTPV